MIYNVLGTILLVALIISPIVILFIKAVKDGEFNNKGDLSHIARTKQLELIDRFNEQSKD